MRNKLQRYIEFPTTMWEEFEEKKRLFRRGSVWDVDITKRLSSTSPGSVGGALWGLAQFDILLEYTKHQIKTATSTCFLNFHFSSFFALYWQGCSFRPRQGSRALPEVDLGFAGVRKLNLLHSSVSNPDSIRSVDRIQEGKYDKFYQKNGTATKLQVSKRQVSKRPVSKRLKRQVYNTSGLQNIRFTKCQVYKMSGLQNVRSSKRLVEKKHPYIFCTFVSWE